MKTMIGVSTEQNTVNLIPALQFGVNRVIILETSVASQKNWSEGLIKVLKDQNIAYEIVNLQKNEDNRIDLIFELMVKKFENSPNQLIWNIGGGQKPQQIAIWETFNFLKRKDDIVCYSNPATRIIEIWKYQSENLTYEEESLNVALTAEEILTVYGKAVKSHGTKIYEKAKKLPLNKVKDLFQYPEFVRYFFETGSINNALDENKFTFKDLKDFITRFKNDSELKNLLENLNEYNQYKYFFSRENQKNFAKNVKNKVLDLLFKSITKGNVNNTFEFRNPFMVQILKELGKGNITPVNNELFELLMSGEKRKAPAFYFEKVVEGRIKKLLEETDQYNFIQEAYSNFESTAGEYDILMVTVWGTLVALDAKTFEIDKKDGDARLYNLTQSAGRYVDWIPVFPYYSSDLEIMPTKLRHLPKTVTEANKKFFVIDDNMENNEVEIDTRNYRLEVFDNILDKLGLLKKADS